ncbi:MAG: dynamin family protein [Pseudobacteriovorax sp.]|nr:dynamin family protein [Pseudobacteriovorax sp.]
MAKDNRYKENYLDSLRIELVSAVERKLSPVAQKYGYSQTNLAEKIKWRPVVLLLGNYSSGKSTLINELLGLDVQKTGQAPTDDSFTVITHHDEEAVEDRDGMVLVNDPEYPFGSLKRHGKRFISHFKLKKVHSPLLENLALIDTPGMLDSVAENDRGYNYQEVIGELAGIADLILILFDPHKAGTIRETYESLRRTIPQSTYEDRVLFVLNRVDECENLNDLLRVYGTLCWNLSQMTGRKDIPHIHFSYSQTEQDLPAFLPMLGNQREDLKASILEAPKYRLDHLSTFIEDHGAKIDLMLSALMTFRLRQRKLFVGWMSFGFLLSLAAGLLSFVFSSNLNIGNQFETFAAPLLSGAIATAVAGLWYIIVKSAVLPGYLSRALSEPDKLVTLQDQFQSDQWDRTKDKVMAFLKSTEGKFSLFQLAKDQKALKDIGVKAARDVREALGEYKNL